MNLFERDLSRWPCWSGSPGTNGRSLHSVVKRILSMSVQYTRTACHLRVRAVDAAYLAVLPKISLCMGICNNIVSVTSRARFFASRRWAGWCTSCCLSWKTCSWDAKRAACHNTSVRAAGTVDTKGCEQKPALLLRLLHVLVKLQAQQEEKVAQAAVTLQQLSLQEL